MIQNCALESKFWQLYGKKAGDKEEASRSVRRLLYSYMGEANALSQAVPLKEKKKKEGWVSEQEVNKTGDLLDLKT